MDLFQAFEAFTGANDLSPAQYSNYFTCLNIIVNLCNITGISWSERLEAFLHSHSASEIRRASNLALREKLRSFDLNQRERFLALWYESYSVLHKKDARLTQIAIQKDFEQTAHHALHTWFNSYSKMVHLQDQVCQARDVLLKRRMFGRFILKYKQTLENNLLARDHQCRLYLKIWKRKSSEIRGNHTKAVNIYQNNSKTTIFDMWYQATTEEHISGLYDKKLASEFLDLWNRRTESIVRRNTSIDVENDQFSLSNALSHWMERLSLVRSMNAQARSIAFKNTLQSTFLTWKRRTVYDSISIDFDEIKNTRMARQAFTAWKMKSGQLKKAREFHEYSCYINQFQAWRRASRLNRLVSIKNETIARRYMKFWRLENRNLQFNRIQNTRSAIDVLDHWSYRLNAIEVRTNERYQQFLYSTNCCLARNYLEHWRTVCDQLQENNQLAIGIYNDKITQLAFDSILSADDLIVQNEEVAAKLYAHNAMKKVIAKWKSAKLNNQRLKRLDALEQFTTTRALELKKKVFHQWVNQFSYVQVLDSNAALIFTQRSSMFETHYWNKWVEKYLVYADNTRKIDSQIRHKSLQFSLKCWMQAKLKLEDNYSKSDAMLATINRPLIERVYRAWTMRMFKLKNKQRDADDFHNRMLAIRLRMFWRKWRAKLREAQNSVLQGNVTTSGFNPLLSEVSAPQSTRNFIPSVESFPSDFIFETPTRQRIRKPLAATTQSRWRKHKTPGTINFNLQDRPLVSYDDALSD